MKTQVIKKNKHLKKGFNPAVITLPVFRFAYLLHQLLMVLLVIMCIYAIYLYLCSWSKTKIKVMLSY